MPVSEICVPPTGPVTLPSGWVLTYDFSSRKVHGPDWHDLSTAEKNERFVRFAARNGQILCLRPGGVAGHPAKFGLTLAEALDHVSINGLRGMIAVDPYDADGEPIMVDGEPLTKWAALPTPERP